MLPRIKKVRHIEKYRLALTFTNGEKAELDFRDRIVGRGGVFAPLENIEIFKQVKVDPEVRQRFEYHGPTADLTWEALKLPKFNLLMLCRKRQPFF